MLQIHSTTTPLEDAAHALNHTLAEAAGCDVLLLLSGGSALALLPLIDGSLITEHTTMTVLDERFTRDPGKSNFAQLVEHPFFAAVTARGASGIDTRPQGTETLEEAADRFNRTLLKWHSDHPDGMVAATMGIGPDGHTSGVLPDANDGAFRSRFVDTPRAVVGYRVTSDVNPHTERMTTTLAYLADRVSHAIVYAAGESKRNALQRTLAQEGSLHETPARILHKIGRVDLFTDIQ